MKMLSCKDAAKILKVHHSRIRQFISEGRLPAQKIGNQWIIFEHDLDLVADRKTGRPPIKKKRKGIK